MHKRWHVVAYLKCVGKKGMDLNELLAEAYDVLEDGDIQNPMLYIGDLQYNIRAAMFLKRNIHRGSSSCK